MPKVFHLGRYFQKSRRQPIAAFLGTYLYEKMPACIWAGVSDIFGK
jgi:hypothetical protein